MKICLITGAWPPAVCGVADGVNLYAERATRDSSVDFHVITTLGYHKLVVERPNLVVHDIVRKWSWTEWGLILEEVKRIKPDIVHIQYPTKEYGKRLFINFLPLLVRLAGYKTVITIHEYSFNLTVLGRMRLWPSIFAAHAVLVSDPGYISDMRKVFPKKRIEPIPIASNIPASWLDLSERQNLKAKMTGDPNTLLLGYFGFLNSNKILMPLFGVLRRLTDEYHIPVKFLLIGDLARDNADMESIREEIDRLGLNDNCIFTGRVDDWLAADYLASVDFAVLLYTSGVSPRNATFLAARGQNIKIITTANPSYLIDSEWVFTVDQDQDLPDQLCEIILRNKDKTPADFKKNFFDDSWNAFLAKHMEVFHWVLAEKKL